MLISRYVPNIMAPLTVVLSGVLAIAANVPRFFELQVVFTMSLSWLFYGGGENLECGGSFYGNGKIEGCHCRCKYELFHRSF